MWRQSNSVSTEKSLNHKDEQERKKGIKHTKEPSTLIWMIGLCIYLPLITLNVNELKYIDWLNLKREKILTKWYAAYKKLTSPGKTYDTCRLKVKEWENMYDANGNQK